jgi:hypothetical protein
MMRVWRLTKARSELHYDIDINAQVRSRFAPAVNDSFRARYTFVLTRTCYPSESLLRYEKNPAYRDVSTAEAMRKFCVYEGENEMWIRSSGVCKTILRKLRLRASVRCQCGWSCLVCWISKPKYTATGKGTHVMKEIVMAKVIEFYVPQKFKNSRKWVPQPQLGKVIEFHPPAAKSA